MRKQTFHHFAVIFSAVCWLWTGPAIAQDQPVQDAITVEEAVRMAVEQNLELKIQEQDIGIAQGGLIQTRLYLNPELELQGETDALFSREGEGRFSVGLGQTFFVGSKRRHRIGIAELNINKASQAVENARRLLIADVKEAYYTILLLQEKQKLAEDLIGINERLVRLTEGRFQEGFSPELDLNLAKIQLQQAQRARTEIERDLSVARAGLNLLLGRPVQASLIAHGELTTLEIRPDPSRLKEDALNHRADLKERDTAFDIAGEQIDLAKAERFPDVTLSLDYAQERSILSQINISDRSRLAGLKLSVPLPFFDRKQGEIAQTRVLQEKAGLERMRLQAVIEKEIQDAVSRLEAAQRAIQLFGGGILPLAESHLNLTQKAYEQGQAGILDVMEAQRRFSETRLGSLEARYEYNAALVELERVIGMDPTRPEAHGSQEGGMK